MDTDEYHLASAQTPLGLLQRGRGAGFLWALGHAEEARPLLVRCITRDPRWDRQLESRAPYYAEIALAVGLDLSPLERHLREHDDANRDGYGSLLAVETLHAMACAGSDEALRMQGDYIAYGAHWDTALHGLVVLANANELPLIPGAQQALDGLLAAVRARFSNHEALVAALDREWPDYEPWRQWAQRDTEIAAALAEAEAGYLRSQRPRTPAANLSTREILARPDVRSFRRALAARCGGENAALLLDAARSGSGDAQAAALIALGEQNDARVLEPALSLLPSVPPPPASSWMRYAILRALSGLPADPGLVYARKWYQTNNFVLRRSAENIFARHAEPEDATMLREGAQRAFEEGDDYRVCDAMDALARIPQLGPYPEVRAVFDGHRYSRARADAAAALAATDPAFPRDRAFECLWDCDDSARATGCAHVDLALPDARERLLRLASDPLEEEEVREAARDAQSRT
ncbi:MAG: hypothetical protein E6J63_11525 [Deltaproteobacteria bacterium]|nr:MAG: hypothetical protein E6J63_11525 [Deltaproteobacteria bacterium]